MQSPWKELGSCAAIVVALVVSFVFLYAFGVSSGTWLDELVAVAIVSMSLAVFEFGRFADRHNRQQANPRARRRVLNISQARNLVAILALAVACGVDAENLSLDEAYKLISFASLLAIIEVVKAVSEDIRTHAIKFGRDLAELVGRQLESKLADLIVGLLIALLTSWTSNWLVRDVRHGNAVPTPIATTQPDA